MLECRTVCSVRTAGLTYDRDVLGTHESVSDKEHCTGGHKEVAASKFVAWGDAEEIHRCGLWRVWLLQQQETVDWVWIAQNACIILCICATGRSSKVLEDKFGESLKNMVAVTDRHSAYFALNFLDHQVCLVHLLRKLEYLTELAPKQNYSKDVEDQLRKAIHERNGRNRKENAAWKIRHLAASQPSPSERPFREDA